MVKYARSRQRREDVVALAARGDVGRQAQDAVPARILRSGQVIITIIVIIKIVIIIHIIKLILIIIMIQIIH